MTMTQSNGDTDRADPTPDELPAAVARERAKAAWAESGGTLVGEELGPMFGRSGRTGRNWVTAFRQEAAATAGKAAGKPAVLPAKMNGTTRPAPTATPVATERKPPAAAHRKPAVAGPVATPLPLLVLTVAAVGTVAAVCAVVSYIHIRDLAVTAGMGGLSGWLPLGIDGLAVACTCSLIADRRQDQSGHPLAVAGLVLGIGGSLVANVLAVDPELVPLRAVRWGLAGYPPLALAVSAHMLFRMLGERR